MFDQAALYIMGLHDVVVVLDGKIVACPSTEVTGPTALAFHLATNIGCGKSSLHRTVINTAVYVSHDIFFSADELVAGINLPIGADGYIPDSSSTFGESWIPAVTVIHHLFEMKKGEWLTINHLF